jgi:murein L,D-transpeptidase YafK
MTNDRISERTLSLMASKSMSPSDPVLIRIYKKESELEVWKQRKNGTYDLLRSYPICRWSGQLGPKTREGDRQAPEGFYAINASMMNPKSRHFRSFNLGYPNAYDRSHGYSGSYLMVHGGCSSRGCYSMTDAQMSEIYALMRESFFAGQKNIQVHALPFRMTPHNLALYRSDPRMPFWRMLKQGSDIFELTQVEPRVAVCGRRYVFNGGGARTGSCSPIQNPMLAQALNHKHHSDEREIHALVAKGLPATHRLYQDGDQHASFRSPFGMRIGQAEVSRPEALTNASQEMVIAQNREDSDGPLLTVKNLPRNTGPYKGTPQKTMQVKKSRQQHSSKSNALEGKKVAHTTMIMRQPSSPTALYLRDTLKAAQIEGFRSNIIK